MGLGHDSFPTWLVSKSEKKTKYRQRGETVVAAGCFSVWQGH